MKRLLSLAIAIVMMLACAVPVFSTGVEEIPDGRVYTIDVYAEDAAIDESTNTVDMYFDLANNLGVYDLWFEVMYPKCLTLTGHEIVYEMAEGYNAYIQNTVYEDTNPYTFYRYTDMLDIDAYGIIGCDPDEVALYLDDPENHPWQNIETENKFAFVMFGTYKNDDYADFAKENGRFLKFSFSYDPTLNTANESELPINLFPCKSNPPEGVIGLNNPYVFPYYNYRFYGANIEVPSLSGACEHEFTVAVTEPESCLSIGSKTYTCTKCGETKDILYYMGHSYYSVNTATCTQNGKQYQPCEVCGRNYFSIEPVFALGHDFEEEFTVDVKPTTTSPGQKSRHCTRCDAVTDVTEIPKLMKVEDLFTDGRTMTPERAANLLNSFGLYCYTDSEGQKRLDFHNVITVVAEIEDLDAFFADPEGCEKLAASMGFNSEYVCVEFLGQRTEFLSRLCGDNKHYDVACYIKSDAYELFGINEMSTIDRLYLNLLLLCGGQWIMDYVIGGEDYTKTETFKRDVNLDGSFNAKDVAYMKKFMSGTVTAINLAAADQDGDGKINVRDLQSIKRKITGAN